MIDTYSLTLPLPPSVNHYYLRNKQGGMRVSVEGEDFRWQVMQAVRQSKMPKLKGRICLVARIFPKDKRITDIDNRIKALQDALQIAGAFENDSQIDELHIMRGAIVSGGRAEVLIGEILAKQE